MLAGSKAAKLVLAAGAGYMVGLVTGWATYTAWIWWEEL